MFFLIFYILFFIVIIILLLFSSKRFSPIPYFPTNNKDLSLIINALDLKNNQTVFDLGAGDGIVIFEAAKRATQKKLNTKFIAVEINVILVLILHLRRLFHPNKKNIQIVWGDFFKMTFSHPGFISGSRNKFGMTHDVTFYLYISPWFLDKVAKKILKEFPKARIISYMYPIKVLKQKKAIKEGKNPIFLY